MTVCMHARMHACIIDEAVMCRAVCMYAVRVHSKGILMSEVCDGWEAAAHAEQEADGRHQGRYEGATEEGTQPHRRGSLVADAVSVGAATVAATHQRQASPSNRAELGVGSCSASSNERPVNELRSVEVLK